MFLIIENTRTLFSQSIDSYALKCYEARQTKSLNFVQKSSFNSFLKVRIQTSDYSSTLRDCFPKMKAEEGAGTFYKGLVPLWMRQIPYTMMKFSCFEKTVEAIYANIVPKPREQCTKVNILYRSASFAEKMTW